jgi:hypothetical protein
MAFHGDEFRSLDTGQGREFSRTCNPNDVRIGIASAEKCASRRHGWAFPDGGSWDNPQYFAIKRRVESRTEPGCLLIRAL